MYPSLALELMGPEVVSPPPFWLLVEEKITQYFWAVIEITLLGGGLKV